MPAGEIIAVVTGVVGCVAAVVIPCLSRPVGACYDYLTKNPEENLENLEAQELILINLEKTVIDNGLDDVEVKWMENAKKTLKKITNCQNAGTSSFFKVCWCFAPYRKRYLAGKHISKIEKDVRELRNELGNKRGMKLVSNEENRGEFIRIREDLVGQQGVEVIEEIISSLEYEKATGYESTTILGIYGAIGVGKTESVAHVCNTILRVNECFITFIWVEATSYEDDLQKLQMKIASKLDVKLSMDGSVRDNAIVLKTALLKKKKILLVLDDVRKAFSLEEIGLPTISESQIKIIITSRSFRVCCQMKCDLKFALKSLSNEEAYELLTYEIPENFSAEEIQSSLKKIAKECGGLPLAIEMVAEYLRKLEGYNLIATNRFLKMECTSFSNLKYITDKVFQDLKLGYEQLKYSCYTCAKECLLYCTMYPRNHAFAATELMTYWIGEGLLRDVEGLDEKLGEAKEILEELKDASLLESTAYADGVEIVKVHPLAWDMVVKIEKENPQFFAKRDCRLDKIEYEDWHKIVTRVSLMRNNLKELQIASVFHWLSTLILQGNPLDFELDCDFFNSFPNLKILDLSDTHVRLLPESLFCLKYLTVLLLLNCIHLTCLPSLSRLGALMILDISGCPVVELASLLGLSTLMILNISGGPATKLPALSEFVALMVLNVSGCNLTELPSLSGLVALMILNISGCPITELPSLSGLVALTILNVSGCPITELPSLSGLVALTILNVSDCPITELPDGMIHLINLLCLNLSGTRVRIFPSGLLAKLENLQELLTIGCEFSWIQKPTTQDDNAACIEDVLKLQYLTVLEITFASFQVFSVYAKSKHCDQLRSFKFCVGGLYNGQLRNKSIAFMKDFPTDLDFLPRKAPELLLLDCANETPFPIPGSNFLESLKILDVSFCNQLKCLFKAAEQLFLFNLEELVITNCSNLQKVMDDDQIRDDYEKSFPTFISPRLLKLTLLNIPELRCVNDSKLRSRSIQAIGI